MPTHSYTSRRELEEYHFSPVVVVLVPLGLLLLQAYLPKIWRPLSLLELPLLAVIFFAVARRNPIFGAVIGAVIGLVQDALTHQPIGINGIAKSIIGYAASSIGVQVDVESQATRMLMTFGFSLLQSGLLFLIHRLLLGETAYRILWLHELLRAAINTALAIPLYLVLDTAKRRD